jgi:hypothetical protein
VISTSKTVAWIVEAMVSIAGKTAPTAVCILFLPKKILFASKNIFFVSEKIFFVPKTIFFVSEKTFFGSKTIFFVSEKTFFVSKTIFFVSKTLERELWKLHS